MGIDCSIDFLADSKHLIVVDKSAFTDILGGVTYITTQ